MNLLGKLRARIGWALSGGIPGRKPVETSSSEHWIDNPDGPKLYAHVHTPALPGIYPGVVFVPGGSCAGTVYDKGSGLMADDVASLGFAVLHYDPSGRGKTGGEEDYWGRRHQKELSVVLNYFHGLGCVKPDSIGILSFSIGISICAGALARYSLPFVKYLFDWEGPSNRFNITRNDTHKPLAGFPSSDIEFWKEREAARFIGRVQCGYFRYQANKDHVQGNFKEHAIELVNLATRGNARWTRMNDNPPNMLFSAEKSRDYHWIPSHRNHKGMLLRYLLQIQAGTGVA